MRWADLDELSHVNNVVYLDYAVQARAAHVAAGELLDAPVGSVSVEYLRPLLLRRVPVVVATRTVDDVLVQEIAPAGADVPFARVTSRPRAELQTLDTGQGEPYAVRVRHSDLGVDGTVTVSKVFEYAQEARIASVVRARGVASPGRFVVARVDLTVGEPFAWRPEPYAAETAVTHVGTSSFTVSTLFEGGRYGRTDAVLVGFDLQAQRSRPLTDDERAALTGA